MQCTCHRLVSNIKQSTCHGLLTSCVSYLFHKLDGFHDLSTQASHSSMSSDETFVEHVFLELLTLSLAVSRTLTLQIVHLFWKFERLEGVTLKHLFDWWSGIISIESFAIVKNVVDNEPLHVYRINVLEGRNRRWKFLSTSL